MEEITDPSKLREALIDKYSISELKNLSHDLNIDYEKFPTEKGDFARELVEYMKRRGQLAELSQKISRERPDNLDHQIKESVLRKSQSTLPTLIVIPLICIAALVGFLGNRLVTRLDYQAPDSPNAVTSNIVNPPIVVTRIVEVTPVIESTANASCDQLIKVTQNNSDESNLVINLKMQNLSRLTDIITDTATLKLIVVPSQYIVNTFESRK